MLRNPGLKTGPLWRGLALAVLVVTTLLIFVSSPEPAHAIDTPGNVTVTGQAGALKVSWDRVAIPQGNQEPHWYVLRWRVKEPQGSWIGEGHRGSSQVRYGLIHGNPGCTQDNDCSYTLTNTQIRLGYSTTTFQSQLDSALLVPGTTYEVQVTTYSRQTQNQIHQLGEWSSSAEGSPLATDVTLSNLELFNATTSSTAPVGLNAPFSNDYSYYVALVLKEVTSITVKPTATSHFEVNIAVKVGKDGAPTTVRSGYISSAIDIPVKADATVPHEVYLTLTAVNDSTNTKTYTVRVFQFDPVSFGGVTVPDMHFTAGHETERGPLPADTTDHYDVTYTATGLPAGLYLSQDRYIVGTPEAADSNPVTVTYTAEGSIGSTASLTFDVTVAPPVAFAEDAFGENNRISFEYTIGQSASINATLPEATGGHGDLTYRLVYVVSEGGSIVTKTINDDAPGFSFDAATRVLTSDTGTSAPSTAAFYSVDYWAVDENGARAYGRVNITVNDAPSLPEIEDKSLTVGVEASITLPKATGGTLREEPRLQYDLEPSRDLSPDLEGLSYNGGEHVISGTPTLPGSTELTYTVTDFNGVSASKTFTINVVNGPTAPTSAPGSVSASQESSGDDDGYTVIVGWDPLSGATAYVVQVKVDGGSYPDKPYNSLPPETFMSFASDGTRAWVNVGGLEVGDYKVRVAARNADGVGPWASEVGFTVQPGGV